MADSTLDDAEVDQISREIRKALSRIRDENDDSPEFDEALRQVAEEMLDVEIPKDEPDVDVEIADDDDLDQNPTGHA